MATPLSATARIVLPVVSGGKTHTYRAYVRNLQLVAGVWTVNSRAVDANDMSFPAAAQGMWDALSYVFATGTANPVARLEELDGVTWVIRDTFATAGAHQSGSVVLASAAILSLRDQTFLPVKVEVLDTVLTGLQNYESPPSGTSAEAMIVKQYTADFTVTAAPFQWQVGRSNQFLADSPFVSFVVAPNRHLRLIHGLV